MGEIKEYGIILSNDVLVPEDSMSIMEEVGPHVDGIKIGIASVLEPGLQLLRNAKKIGKPILADFKVADIGFLNEKLITPKWEGTNNKIVGQAIDAGADYVICHTFPGTSSIEEAIQTAHTHNGKVLTLPYMTHKGAGMFFNHPLDKAHVKKVAVELGIMYAKLDKRIDECNTISDMILVLGEHYNVDGFIGPANNLDILKNYRKFTESKICTPGVGRQNKAKTYEQQLQDVYEACGPNSAVIIGSDIYKADNPVDAAKNFADIRDKVVREL